jgi:hypothetical protein
MTNIYFNKCIASIINMTCRTTSFKRLINSITNNPLGKKVLHGKDFKPKRDQHIGRMARDITSFLTEDG